MPPAPGTPSQTSGPYAGLGLPFPGGGDLVPAGHPGAVTLHGHVLDGEGAPVPGAVLELWQPGPDGSRAGAPGSLRRDGVTFTGFARVTTGADGHYALRTLLPGGVPYAALCLHVRGLQRHLCTRAYFSRPADDPLLASVPEERVGTLLAVPERPTAGAPPAYRFDVRLRGEGETVFLTV
ncbi:protocatechuate 3,4-dioxygenase subunit alpha [Streptomyces sp. URMC 126]|uniref:protocatechuate 3,4-dioxygenase subunit alpha n=1 Tax=Streptomyces sp. URMC 126 TaxID=3423401 RepID=UPI003F1CEDA1